ncbi:MAG TPA: BTAD domain-containing putative transcriptional regulator [Methylibium sp.]|uniref:AfsR/SARP family transcriptional regulator n=1 Tax=Methylibium sp. TaxID=2067992 RepID=UPI002DBB5E65|nr:BTAD domain-containing putative transcriptional regulator [Methylibium sp.]HEU4460471.1 BTAD domain-containing putative transcriptional regulator [Methylibium sp.]
MSAARPEAARVCDDQAPARTDSAALRELSPASGCGLLTPERRMRASRRQGDRRGAAGIAPAEAEADLAARLLGPFALQVRGVAVLDWPASRAKSLLKYLLLHRERPTTRQAVLETFWPEIEPEAARNNLHVAIHRLRRLLQGCGLGLDAVRCADGIVELKPGLSIWLDTECFDAALDAAQALGPGAPQEAALAAALALTRGELVATERGEAWLEPLRQRFNDRALLALRTLAESRFAARDEPACIEHAHRMLALDGCAEEAHRLLMRSYARLAQPARVERQYRACVQALRGALGVAPHPQTTALYRALFAQARGG